MADAFFAGSFGLFQIVEKVLGPFLAVLDPLFGEQVVVLRERVAFEF